MKNWFKKIKAWWKPFFEKHEVEIIVSGIQGPGFGFAICIPPKGAPIWVGIVVCCAVIILAWTTAYFTRKHNENKRKKIYERYNKRTS